MTLCKNRFWIREDSSFHCVNPPFNDRWHANAIQSTSNTLRSSQLRQDNLLRPATQNLCGRTASQRNDTVLHSSCLLHCRYRLLPWCRLLPKEATQKSRNSFFKKVQMLLRWRPGFAGQWHPRTKRDSGYGCHGPALQVRASASAGTILTASPCGCVDSFFLSKSFQFEKPGKQMHFWV